MGVGVEASARFRDPDACHQFRGACGRRRATHVEVHIEHLCDVFAHGHDRVERRERILRDQGDAPAT